jgi:hypothetical protein
MRNFHWARASSGSGSPKERFPISNVQQSSWDRPMSSSRCFPVGKRCASACQADGNREESFSKRKGGARAPLLGLSAPRLTANGQHRALGVADDLISDRPRQV